MRGLIPLQSSNALKLIRVTSDCNKYVSMTTHAKEHNRRLIPTQIIMLDKVIL